MIIARFTGYPFEEFRPVLRHGRHRNLISIFVQPVRGVNSRTTFFMVDRYIRRTGVVMQLDQENSRVA